MLMSELQYYSPGRCIYYWFGEAFGIIQSGKNKGCAIYMGSEAEVKEALVSGKQSNRRLEDEILKRERELSGGKT